ncbi:MAG: hypothetical protein IPG81_34015 [Sandaracinaceae bacterium]|nr:hypothetical protein [Sandaracinaceae bacterium]
MAVSPRLLAVPASVLLVRAALLVFAAAVVAPGLLLALDLAALLVAALAVVFGRVIGGGFGSTVLTFVGVGLPIAGLGALTDVVVSREASNLFAGPARDERFSQSLVLLLGLGALALGVRLLIESGGLRMGGMVSAPYLVAATLALVLRPLAAAPRRPA